MTQSTQSPSSAAPAVVVYTRAGCHLCDEAAQLLGAYGLAASFSDIDADPQLRALHTDWVPVVEIGGRIRFRGRIDPVLLERIVRTEFAPPSPAPDSLHAQNR